MIGDLVLEMCFQSTSKAKSNLKPIVLDEIMEAHREKVTELVLRESAGPVEHSKLYDKYSFLINKQVSHSPLSAIHHYRSGARRSKAWQPKMLFTQFLSVDKK